MSSSFTGVFTILDDRPGIGILYNMTRELHDLVGCPISHTHDRLLNFHRNFEKVNLSFSTFLDDFFLDGTENTPESIRKKVKPIQTRATLKIKL